MANVVGNTVLKHTRSLPYDLVCLMSFLADTDWRSDCLF